MIDGLRAAAAIAVLVGHASFLAWFNGHGAIGAVFSRFDVGVALFFVISGFLLYRPFVAARYHQAPAPRIALYARRRALRIVPAYWLALTVLNIWPGLRGDVFGHAPVYYLFLQDFRSGWILGGIGAAWSLAVEVQFYVLMPFVAIALSSRLRGRLLRHQVRAELAVLAGLGSASLVTRTLTFADPTPDTWSNTIAGTFLWFSSGMSLAVLSAAWHSGARRSNPLRFAERFPAGSWAMAVGLLLASSRLGLPTTAPQHYSTVAWSGEHVIYGLIAFFAVAPATVPTVSQRSICYRVATFRPVAWLGLVSYGIFLWHHPLTERFISVRQVGHHLGFPLYTLSVFAVATACAAASYYLVERPLLRLKDPRPRDVRLRRAGHVTPIGERARSG